MHSLSSSHSQLSCGGGPSRRRDSSDTKRYAASDDTGSTASQESGTNSSRHSTGDGSGAGAGGGGGDGGSTVSTTSTTTSTLLKTVLGRKDGEGVDDLVSRILREAKEHGRLSEYTAASLRPQLSTTTVASMPTMVATKAIVSMGDPHDYADLLPSAKAAVDISSAARSRETSPHRYVTNSRNLSHPMVPPPPPPPLLASSGSSRLLSAAAQSVLDQQTLDHDAVHMATRRVLDKRYPFPVESTATAFSSRSVSDTISQRDGTTHDVQTKLLHLQQQAREIVSRSRSPSPTRPKRSAATTTTAMSGAGEELTSEIDRLVKDLHHCVLQRTMKEAQLRLLRGEDPTAFL